MLTMLRAQLDEEDDVGEHISEADGEAGEVGRGGAQLGAHEHEHEHLRAPRVAHVRLGTTGVNGATGRHARYWSGAEES